VPPNASLLGETLAHCATTHITTTHFVNMLVSSRQYSHHHYSCEFLLVNTHVTTTHYITAGNHGSHTCMKGATTACLTEKDWCIGPPVSRLQNCCTIDAIRTSYYSACACVIISAKCSHKHTGKNQIGKNQNSNLADKLAIYYLQPGHMT
jgi:hypothetical protein